MSDDRRAQVLRALRARRFKPVATRAGARAFEGPLQTKFGDVPVKLEIEDWEFLTYPKIALVARPMFLPPLMAHVDSSGGLCYLRPGSILLDRHQPGGAILQCLDAATNVLETIVQNPAQGAQDIQDEFLAYWEGGQGAPFSVALGEIAPDSKAAQYFLLDLERLNGKLALIASDRGEVLGLAKALGAAAPTECSCKCWIARSTKYPAVPAAGLPKTIKELFRYLQEWDRSVYNRVQAVLESEKEYLRYSFVTFAIETPAGWLGFLFDLHPLHRQACARNPRLYKQYLHGRAGGRAITRLAITEVGPTFLHGRNLSHVNLTNKKVVLVGCGAIGGYLGQAVARLGAGTGPKGRLRLIDSGIFGPENVGRHWLGIPSLFLPKAQAVGEELKRHFPHATVEWEQLDVANAKALFDADLVIDASGEEAVNAMLNERHLARTDNKPPVLYCWIKGNGEASQALWVDSTGGCYRCLRLPAGSQYMQERLPILKRVPETRFRGCQTFTPYAVSAPMASAALAAEMVGDWLKGDPSPRFRSRGASQADLRKIHDQDISKLKGCPACSDH